MNNRGYKSHLLSLYLLVIRDRLLVVSWLSLAADLKRKKRLIKDNEHKINLYTTQLSQGTNELTAIIYNKKNETVVAPSL